MNIGSVYIKKAKIITNNRLQLTADFAFTGLSRYKVNFDFVGIGLENLNDPMIQEFLNEEDFCKYLESKFGYEDFHSLNINNLVQEDSPLFWRG